MLLIHYFKNLELILEFIVGEYIPMRFKTEAASEFYSHKKRDGFIRGKKLSRQTRFE